MSQIVFCEIGSCSWVFQFAVTSRRKSALARQAYCMDSIEHEEEHLGNEQDEQDHSGDEQDDSEQDQELDDGTGKTFQRCKEDFECENCGHLVAA